MSQLDPALVQRMQEWRERTQKHFAGQKMTEPVNALGGFTIQGYQSYKSNNPDHEWNQYLDVPRFWAYDMGITMAYLLLSGQRDEAKWLADRMVEIAKQMNAAGEKGGWRFSYGPTFTDARAMSGGTAWVFKGLYAVALQVRDPVFLDYVNQQFAEVAFTQQVMTANDSRYGLFRAGYGETMEGPANVQREEVTTEHNWDYIDALRLAYRANAQVSPQHPMLAEFARRHELAMRQSRAMLLMTEATVRAQMARLQKAGRLTPALRAKHEKVIAEIRRLPGQRRWATGMEPDGTLNLSWAWDNEGWSPHGAYDPALARDELKNLEARFLKTFKAKSFSNLPAGVNPEETFTGLIFFTGEFEDPHVPPNPVFEEMIQLEATWGYILRLIQFGYHTTDAADRRWAYGVAQQLLRSSLRLSEIYSGAPYATKDVHNYFNTLLAIASNAYQGMVLEVARKGGAPADDLLNALPHPAMLVNGKPAVWVASGQSVAPAAKPSVAPAQEPQAAPVTSAATGALLPHKASMTAQVLSLQLPTELAGKWLVPVIVRGGMNYLQPAAEVPDDGHVALRARSSDDWTKATRRFLRVYDDPAAMRQGEAAATMVIEISGPPDYRGGYTATVVRGRVPSAPPTQPVTPPAKPAVQPPPSTPTPTTPSQTAPPPTRSAPVAAPVLEKATLSGDGRELTMSLPTLAGKYAAAYMKTDLFYQQPPVQQIPPDGVVTFNAVDTGTANHPGFVKASECGVVVFDNEEAAANAKLMVQRLAAVAGATVAIAVENIKATDKDKRVFEGTPRIVKGELPAATLAPAAPKPTPPPAPRQPAPTAPPAPPQPVQQPAAAPVAQNAWVPKVMLPYSATIREGMLTLQLPVEWAGQWVVPEGINGDRIVRILFGEGRGWRVPENGRLRVNAVSAGGWLAARQRRLYLVAGAQPQPTGTFMPEAAAAFLEISEAPDAQGRYPVTVLRGTLPGQLRGTDLFGGETSPRPGPQAAPAQPAAQPPQPTPKPTTPSQTTPTPTQPALAEAPVLEKATVTPEQLTVRLPKALAGKWAGAFLFIPGDVGYLQGVMQIPDDGRVEFPVQLDPPTHPGWKASVPAIGVFDTDDAALGSASPWPGRPSAVRAPLVFQVMQDGTLRVVKGELPAAAPTTTRPAPAPQKPPSPPAPQPEASRQPAPTTPAPVVIPEIPLVRENLMAPLKQVLGNRALGPIIWDPGDLAKLPDFFETAVKAGATTVWIGGYRFVQLGDEQQQAILRQAAKAGLRTLGFIDGNVNWPEKERDEGWVSAFYDRLTNRLLDKDLHEAAGTITFAFGPDVEVHTAKDPQGRSLSQRMPDYYGMLPKIQDKVQRFDQEHQRRYGGHAVVGPWLVRFEPMAFTANQPGTRPTNTAIAGMTYYDSYAALTNAAARLKQRAAQEGHGTQYFLTVETQDPRLVGGPSLTFYGRERAMPETLVRVFQDPNLADAGGLFVHFGSPVQADRVLRDLTGAPPRQAGETVEAAAPVQPPAVVSVTSVRLKETELALTLTGVPDGALASAWVENRKGEPGVWYIQPIAYETQPVQGGKVTLVNTEADERRNFQAGRIRVVIVKNDAAMKAFIDRLAGDQTYFNEFTIQTLIKDKGLVQKTGLTVIEIKGTNGGAILKPSGLEEKGWGRKAVWGVVVAALLGGSWKAWQAIQRVRSRPDVIIIETPLGMSSLTQQLALPPTTLPQKATMTARTLTLQLPTAWAGKSAYAFWRGPGPATPDEVGATVESAAFTATIGPDGALTFTTPDTVANFDWTAVGARRVEIFNQATDPQAAWIYDVARDGTTQLQNVPPAPTPPPVAPPPIAPPQAPPAKPNGAALQAPAPGQQAGVEFQSGPALVLRSALDELVANSLPAPTSRYVYVIGQAGLEEGGVLKALRQIPPVLGLSILLLVSADYAQANAEALSEIQAKNNVYAFDSSAALVRWVQAFGANAAGAYGMSPAALDQLRAAAGARLTVQPVSEADWLLTFFQQIMAQLRGVPVESLSAEDHVRADQMARLAENL